jgi:solute carrier family 8 (sodium/calcium exchanger)
MALGSAAPEILLSIIEMFGDNFDSGELGPNVIVGSAAYNLFVIVGYCVLVVPKEEVRRIERLRVFFVTASWMIFAYIWLCLIIVVISPGIVELWEAIVTCLFFPFTIMNAYAVDKKLYLNASERVESARKLIGVTFKLNQKKVRKEKSSAMRRESNAIKSIIGVSSALQTITFSPSYYTCFESVGELEIYVIRHGGDINKTIMVDYKTEDDSAEADSDYLHEEGTLVFRPNEIKKNFNINIIEDSIYEGDEKFYVRLLNARYEDGTVDDHLKISYPDKATVIILDDDHGGVFFFEKTKVEVVESVGIFRIKVLRTIGAKGKVKIPYQTVDSTAIGGKDFKKKNDYIIFYNNETEFVKFYSILDSKLKIK